MEKIINALSYVIFRVDNLLYNTIGVVTPFRRRYWKRRSYKVQRDLEREHSMRDHINRLNGTNYTTKKAIEVYEDKHCL